MRVALRLALLLSLALGSSPLAGCVVASGEDAADDEDAETEPVEDGREAEAARVGVDCSNPRSATGYKSGKSFSIQIVDADGKPIEIATASMYARMQRDAAKAGVAIRVVSGFRTFAQQQKLYNDYLAGRGNLAARPGYSNHQSGHALDLNTSSAGVLAWLNANASKYGFKRTVPSEPWHWEYWGGAVSGGCSTTTSAPKPTSGCWSSTLNRQVVVNTCVQARSDGKWYQCLNGGDWEIRWNVPAACVSEHPL